MNNIKVAWFLARRQLFGKNKKSVILIITVMLLTFINLVGTSGLLVGLIVGSSKEYRDKFIGDLIISPLPTKKGIIIDTESIVNTLKSSPEVKDFSVRYIANGSLESNFNNRSENRRLEKTNAIFYGINPEKENNVTQQSKNILEGEFLNKLDPKSIVVGKDLLSKYALDSQTADASLGDVKIGDKLLVSIDSYQNDYILYGILGGKTDLTRSVLINDTELTKILNKSNNRANQIAVRVKQAGQEYGLKEIFKNAGLTDNQKIETYDEGEPKFIKNIVSVFRILGNVIGGIGVVASLITIFIIIYINAITRRKYIGIMKGIGISPSVIKLSYVFQSIFYCIVGSLFGAIIIYTIMIPYFDANPIDFPFSDGILVAPYFDTFIKFATLLIATVLSGYLPARSVVKQSTLDAILGR